MLPVEVSGYHIHFFTAGYEELLAWYLDVFGLEQRPRGRLQTTTNVPGMNMSFGNAREAAAPTRRRPGQSFRAAAVCSSGAAECARPVRRRTRV